MTQDIILSLIFYFHSIYLRLSLIHILGNKEKISKNPILKSVEEKTKLIQEYLSNKVKTIYEENKGNHFNETAKRIAKGIKWSLEN